MSFFKIINQSSTLGFPGFASKPGSITYTPGTYSFLVPPFRSMTFELWGGGGAGGGTGGQDVRGHAGGDTVVTLPNGYIIKSSGGQGGGYSYSNRWYRGWHPGAGSTGGTASGGDVNLSGKNGTAGTQGTPGRGGDSPNGGKGGAGGFVNYTGQHPNPWGPDLGQPGGVPGAGGGGWDYGNPVPGTGKFPWDTGGGAGGAYSKKTIKIGKVHPHSTITVVVGAGGSSASEGGKGGDGRVIISWT